VNKVYRIEYKVLANSSFKNVTETSLTSPSRICYCNILLARRSFSNLNKVETIQLPPSPTLNTEICRSFPGHMSPGWICFSSRTHVTGMNMLLFQLCSVYCTWQGFSVKEDKTYVESHLSLGWLRLSKNMLL
jgi:hypothetical protein